LRIPWGYVAILYIIIVAGTIACDISYGRSTISTVVVVGIMTCVLACLIIANRLVPARLRFWFILVMAAVFTVASITRLIVQLLTQ
jgi:hypothetical protein